MPPYDTSSAIADDTCSQGSVNTETSGFRLEDVCRVRDEADKLRSEVCALRIRLEEVEEERNFHAAKANEFTQLVKVNGRNEIHEELIRKTLHVAELTTQINRLKADKENLAQENARLQRQNDATRKEMEDLSVVVRSLQTAAYSTDEDDESLEEEDEEEIVLTPEKALNMTLGNMKAHVEVLEDALQSKSAQCKEYKKKIARLEKENEMKEVKVQMLEELFRELNQFRSDEEVRKERESMAVQPVVQSNTKRQLFQKSLSVPALNISEKIRMTRKGVENKDPAPAPTPSGSPNRDSVLNKKPGQMKNIKICFKKAGLEGTYTGPLVDGRPHGVGTIRFTNGSTYLGEMTKGKMTGKGALYTKNQGIFRGRFENNKFVGEI